MQSIRLKLHPEVQKITAEIKADRKNGATTLAARALDALGALARNLDDNDANGEVKSIDLVARLGALRPSMGAIGAQAILALAKARDLAGQGLPWPSALGAAVDEERENLLRADKEIAAAALKEIGPGGIVVTCSYSRTVQATLVALAPEKIIVGEGHAIRDGVRTASELAASGLNVTVTPDGALPVAVNCAKAAIIGADQVLGDGSVVNRCSSFSLALAAKHFKVPFFVVCQSIKLTGESSAVIEESDGLINDPPGGVAVSAPIFDLTPPELVQLVITDKGASPPAEAGERGLLTAKLFERILGTR